MHTAERTIPTHLLASVYLPCHRCSTPATRFHRIIATEAGGWESICIACDAPIHVAIEEARVAS